MGKQLFEQIENRNHIIRNNHKKTYSLPQLAQQIQINSISCGNDFIISLCENRVAVSFKGGIYYLHNLSNIQDVATYDNSVVFVTADGDVNIWEFNQHVLMQGDIKPFRIKIKDKIKKAFIYQNQLMLLNYKGIVLYLKKNQWYQTNIFSDSQILHCDEPIVKISPGTNYHLFIGQSGTVYYSNRENPLNIKVYTSKVKFIRVISTSKQFYGVTTEGKLMKWRQIEDEPSEFGRVTKNFIDITANDENGYAITEDGEAWVWGKNANGQLGLSDYEERTTLFPLITMNDYNIEHIFLGNKYVCGLVTMRPKCSHAAQQHLFHKRQYLSNGQQQIQDKKERKQKINKRQLSEHNIQNKYNLQQARGNDDNGQKQQNIQKQNDIESMNSKRRQESKSVQTTKLKQRIQNQQLQIKGLKRVIRQKNIIIEDITIKIRLLQDAIQQFEKSQNDRDEIVQQYKYRQKEYELHFKQQQNIIYSLINNQGGTIIAYQHDHLVDELKLNFMQEKQKYKKNIKDKENKWNQEKIKLKKSIRKLEDKLMNQDKENCRGRIMGLNQYDVDKVINRIEENKNRISKSVDKLDHMLQQTL